MLTQLCESDVDLTYIKDGLDQIEKNFSLKKATDIVQENTRIRVAENTEGRYETLTEEGVERYNRLVMPGKETLVDLLKRKGINI